MLSFGLIHHVVTQWALYKIKGLFIYFVYWTDRQCQWCVQGTNSKMQPHYMYNNDIVYAVELIIVNQESMDSSFDLNKGRVLLSITSFCKSFQSRIALGKKLYL